MPKRLTLRNAVVAIFGWKHSKCSSQVGHELGRSGGTLTDFTVTHWLVSEGVLSQEVTNHVSFDFDWVPVLAAIDVDDGVAHLWDDDAVSQVGLDGLGLVSWLDVLLGLSEFLDESVVLSSNAVSKSSSLSRVHESDNFITGHLEQLVQLVSSPDLLLEWLLLGNGFRHVF